MRSQRCRQGFRGFAAAMILSLGMALYCAKSYGQELTRPLRFIMLTPFVNYPFFDPVKQGMKDAAASLHVSAEFAGTEGDDMTALARRVHEAIQGKYDGIAINLFDAAAMQPSLAEATRAGIPVISFNVDDRRVPTSRLATIGQDPHRAGLEFGAAVSEFVPAGSHVLLTLHNAGISALEQREAGLKEALKSKGLVWSQLVTTPDRQTALHRIHDKLTADPTIRVILSTGSADTEASGLVVERYFAGSNYVCAGFDLTADTLRLVKAGVIRLTVDQQPYAQGFYSIVGLALNRRFGIEPSNIDTGATIVRSAMADRLIQLSTEHYR